MKKLINDPNDVVTESLRGMALAHPELLDVDLEQHNIYRATPKQGKVALLSGGGSGHEPLHGGFVGAGMLDAACCGEVFTSPVPDQIMEATSKVDSGAGVLHIVKNYTGDVMNFEMAAELAADMSGTEVATVVVNDDVAVQDSLYTAGRRGVGGTLFVEKIAGAKAESGADLETVKNTAQKVIDNTRSFGMALTSCTVPAAGRPTFDLGDNEIELGIGIHGEPGRERSEMKSAHELALELVEPILEDLDFTGSPVVALLGGMGATPLHELYLMYGEVQQILEEKGVRVARSLVGNYVTSLDMAGCALSLLRADEEMLQLWDAPVHTPALNWEE
ncbi:dihydroxyacetone kinase subunit DhaK [Boudabousia liubingyangii]|uniref:phosphoenolpyruvate--glycerone phosphotransferase n=1 Tax=Boudabousia liubingyangii TaxID=1921764 RepID=A0A1Q5PPK4_9ACTO|nr:dihydroxyacetone kinase subunit DhaK [Boudabousia liubingyangii]OKL48495.1 dihydroxyacetone kinase subunit DhaK [Boudabousia liubingyangii]OKL49467.1 dihydroxyacetone kinase subunit DhaK [Boudabousia liubingyangii]